MKVPSRSVYTPLDFAQWKAGNGLHLTPKFQRRGVWKPAARSFFIDSLLRGMPVPPIYVRQTQSETRDRVVREVIDGQQRVAAVLAYLEGDYRLSRTLQADWANKTYDQLTQAERDRINTFPFAVEVFHGISDLEVLEVFSRLNTYSVPLNQQELRNGRFFGRFKQCVYALAYEHLEFWRRHQVFTEQNIARMLEVEFVSEVVVAFVAGMQDKKKSLDVFYEKFDESFPERDRIERRFREVVDDVNASLVDDLKETVFRRPPLLYSLLCAIYHRRYGLPGTKLTSPKKALTKDERMSLASAVRELSEKVEAVKQGEVVSDSHRLFVGASLQQTDNIRPRTERFNAVYRSAFA
jgi:Protein of unknown function DUF262